MKMMSLSNEFSTETRQLYLYNYKCWECGENGSRTGGMELHHILGRCSNSPLNSAPLCHRCHALANQKQTAAKYFYKTLCYLQRQGYKLTEKDELFILENWQWLKSPDVEEWLRGPCKA
jgi:hypothetical protein